MSSKTIRLMETQEELENFLANAKNNTIPGDDIREWIIKGVSHLTEVGVGANIIDLFIDSSKFSEYPPSGFLGFGSHGIFAAHSFYGYRLKGEPYVLPIRVALGTARMLIEKYEDEERLIPKTLIRIFRKENHQSIKTALESIQSNYETKNVPAMVTSLVSATELICNLIPELSLEKGLGFNLNRLYESKDLIQKYSLNREVLWSLNNARIIRNDIVHLKENKGIKISFHEAVSYGHIFLIFINELLSKDLVS
jgi:hypothetical protein